VEGIYVPQNSYPVRISVIVPVYNASVWVEKCIHGLLNQDYDARYFEMILVDNNSSDDSIMRIRRHQRVRLFEETVQSAYAARNRGVRESMGDVLAFTDSDCVPTPNWLSGIASTMRNWPTKAALGSVEPASARGAMRLISDYEAARLEYILKNRRKRAYFAFGGNMAIRRSAFERYGPFPEVSRGGDTLLLQRIANGAGPEAVEWTPHMRVRHLEWQSVFNHFKKSFIYANARKKTRHLGQSESLTASECFHIFRSLSRGLTPWERIELGFLLSAGRLSWAAGSVL
jgi:glycosyltransferase involved in cell wall biosynthesis